MAVEEKSIVNSKVLNFSKNELETIKRSVTKGATLDEFRMFMHLARTYGLDPFNKEIFFIKYNNQKPIIMTSRDGYLKIADRHSAYEGIVSDVVRENDRFKRLPDGSIEHEYGTNRGNIIGAYTLVYRNDRRYPVYVFAPFNEYRAGTKVWNQYPSAMILKVAESMALKRAFTVSGLVSQEEMDVSQNPKDITPKNIDDIDDKNLSEREKEIKLLIGEDTALRNALFSYLNYVKKENQLDKISINDLDDIQFRELKGYILKLKNPIKKAN